MITREFILAGKATFTLEVGAEWRDSHLDCQPHYTYKITRKDNEDGRPPVYFIALLTGPDNEADYTYLGMLNPEVGCVFLTRGSKLPPTAHPVTLLGAVIKRIWRDDETIIEAAGFKLHHEGKCGRCGRTLTVPESIESGIGPECAAKMEGD